MRQAVAVALEGDGRGEDLRRCHCGEHILEVLAVELGGGDQEHGMALLGPARLGRPLLKEVFGLVKGRVDVVQLLPADVEPIELLGPVRGCRIKVQPIRLLQERCGVVMGTPQPALTRPGEWPHQ